MPGAMVPIVQQVSVHYTYTSTPVGELLLIAKAGRLAGVHWVDGKYCPTIEKHWEQCEKTACFRQLKRELAAYFLGEREKFNVPYTLQGTLLQKATWEQLARLPYGAWVSYKTLAELASFPHAVRAVASAVGRNPLALVLPCHRVVRNNGQLGGFVAGIPVKQRLLALEELVCDREGLTANRTSPKDTFEFSEAHRTRSSGGRNRTCDLRIMSPTSYRCSTPHYDVANTCYTKITIFGLTCITLVYFSVFHGFTISQGWFREYYWQTQCREVYPDE